jgi:hypothetical protein
VVSAKYQDAAGKKGGAQNCGERQNPVGAVAAAVSALIPEIPLAPICCCDLIAQNRPASWGW